MSSIDIARYILTALRGRGLTASVTDSGQLAVRPAANLTPGDRAEIAEYKADLIAVLQEERRLWLPPDQWTDLDRSIIRRTAAGAWQGSEPGMRERTTRAHTAKEATA